MVALVLGEVGGSELEGVKKESGAAEIDVVSGDVGNDATDSILDLGAGVGNGHGEGVAAGTALTGGHDRFAGLVVVVTESLATHGGGAAALAFRKGVAALIFAIGVIALFDLFDEFCCLIHE